MGQTHLTKEEENKNNFNIMNLNYYKEEDIKTIELLPIFNKINISQYLLKEMISRKERFDENKNKMVGKIKYYCYTYYKNLLLSKEINEKCKLKDEINERYKFVLINNASQAIDKDFYPSIYNFLFFLRNNNKYMLKILNRCHTRYIKKISYFIAHFCYENTINNNNSFIQEELQIIIYFLIEKIINRNCEEILTYNQEIFLYKLLEYLIRKVDIKNYLDDLLSDPILKLERAKNSFMIELVKKEKSDGEKAKIQKKMLVQKGKLQTDIHLLNSNKKEKISDDKKEALLDRMRFSIFKANSANTNNEDKYEKIDNFFIKNNVTSKYISEKLSFYENLKEKDQISLAMIYFLENHFSILISKAKEDDKLSNNYFFGLFAKDKSEKKEQKVIKEKYIQNIKKKYDSVISCFVNLMIKVEETLPNMPKPIINILNILDYLIEKKISTEKDEKLEENEKNKKISYFTLMAKVKIFIGNLVLPIIKHYYSNRILDELILTRSTSEILKTLEIIFNSIISGKLFDNNNEPEFTIYNKFIIDIIPRLLSISMNIGLINKKQNLNNNFFSILLELTQTFDKIKDENRIIDYQKLKKDKNEEKIQYQSICFNWEVLNLLVKTVEKDKEYFINEYNTDEGNKIFEEILKINQEINLLNKKNQVKKEYEYYIIDKIIYDNDFEQKINSIIRDNFENNLLSDKNEEKTRFKKCLSEVLGYIGELHKEDFIPFIIRKENMAIYSNEKTKLFFNYKKNIIFNDMNFEKTEKSNNMENKKKEEAKKEKQSKKKSFIFQDRDRFFTRRKSVVNPWLENFGDTDFKTVLFPKIMSLIKTDVGNFFECEKFQRIIFCLTYIQTHFDNLPIEYRKDNYSKIFTEIISDTKVLIQELQNNILNVFFMKIRYTEKLNEIVNKYYNQHKIMEKYFYIKYLYKNTKVYGNIVIEKNNKDIITKIKFEKASVDESKFNFINSFLHEIPYLSEYESKMEENEDFWKNQEKIGLIDVINEYFKELKISLKNEKILCNLNIEEFSQVLYGLENYILKKLNIKLFPTTKSKQDNFIYKKCTRLSFIKPANIIKDEKFKNISEKLLKISIEYIKEIDFKKTPMDKINIFGKAMNFVNNSLQFNSGKKEFGVDDILPILIYIVIKAKPESFYSNYNYCLLYLNNDLKKSKYGSILTQMGLILDIIKNMKYNDLNNVTKEQFGVDEDA